MRNTTGRFIYSEAKNITYFNLNTIPQNLRLSISASETLDLYRTDSSVEKAVFLNRTFLESLKLFIVF